jgi:nitroreductase
MQPVGAVQFGRPAGTDASKARARPHSETLSYFNLFFSPTGDTMTDGITMTSGTTMTNAVIECILSRSAAKYYDPAATLSDDQIRELVRIGTTAPTSFHLQNWRFIAVRTPEAKARLRPIAWDQPAITEAAVTFIVCGQLADSSVIPGRLAPLVEAGIMPAKMVPDWEIPARDLYMEYPQRQRDEAVRTGTFGAAAMIYAARSLGLGSTPMIGFDAEAVAREFALAEDEVPVMLLSVGAERAGIGYRNRAVRWPMYWNSHSDPRTDTAARLQAAGRCEA